MLTNDRVLLMDLSQAAFGLDMKAASRIYFINPVLNPQVEAQAIGRARRVSQQKPVTVETLVLKNSLDEVILERKEHMTQAEHRQAKSILDIRPIFNWIKNTQIEAMPGLEDHELSQMALLEVSHHVFGRGFGRTTHPDDGLVPGSPAEEKADRILSSPAPVNGVKRAHWNGVATSRSGTTVAAPQDDNDAGLAERPARRVRFG